MGAKENQDESHSSIWATDHYLVKWHADSETGTERWVRWEQPAGGENTRVVEATSQDGRTERVS